MSKSKTYREYRKSKAPRCGERAVLSETYNPRMAPASQLSRRRGQSGFDWTRYLKTGA